jgi:hypothetical protein
VLAIVAGVPVISVGLTATGDSTVAIALGVWLAGGATTRGVSVGRGEASGLASGTSKPMLGEPADCGEACRVAVRSTESWVSTLGAIVMTSSFGCELERVRRTASRRLDNNAPAAINALMRFNSASRSRRSQTPALGLRTATAGLPARVDSFASAYFTRARGKSSAGNQVCA